MESNTITKVAKSPTESTTSMTGTMYLTQNESWNRLLSFSFAMFLFLLLSFAAYWRYAKATRRSAQT